MSPSFCRDPCARVGYLHLNTLARSPRAGSLTIPASQRRMLARGDGIPAATFALHCLVSSLAGRWACSAPPSLNLKVVPSVVCGAAGLPLPDGSSEWSEADLVEGATQVCRVARNCFPEIDHQDDTTHAASSECITLLLWLVTSHTVHASCSAADPTKLEVFLAAALQAIGNAVSSSRRLCVECWDAAWPSPLINVIMGHGARCQSVVAMIIYNTYYHYLRKNPEPQAAFVNHEAVGELLAALLATTYSMRAQVVSETESKFVADVSEWTQLLVTQLLRDGHLIPLHQRLSTMPKVGDRDSEKQLWFLVEDIFAGDCEDASAQEPILLREADYEYMATEFGMMMTLCLQEAGSIAQQTQQSEVGGGARVVARMMQLLQVLGACTVREGKMLRRALRSKGLITNISNLLHTLFSAVPGATEEHRGPLMTENVKGVQKHGEEAAGLGGMYGLKRDLVRVLGNMCYRDRESQEAVREAEAIPLILACTNVDEANPFAKEWAILAVRNLCENNVENQAVIARLQPQAVQSVPPEMQQRGVGVQLDQAGKIKIVRDSQATRDESLIGGQEHAGTDAVNGDRRAEEMRNMGLGLEMEEGARVGGTTAPVKPLQGGDGLYSSGRAGVEASADDGNNAEEMAAELRSLGLHAQVDPDTGLMDIRHPRSEAATFSYPVRDGHEGPSPHPSS